jgi:hypothetical protein
MNFNCLKRTCSTCILFFASILLFTSAFGQLSDDDKDGVLNSQDYYSSTEITKANIGYPVNSNEKMSVLFEELTEQDKKTLIANFQKVLQNVPTKFDKLKTGEEDWDITNRTSWYRSNLQLFPNHTDKNKTQLMFGQYSGKPVIAFIENAPADVNTIVTILMPVLKAKGMAEVNTKFVMDDPAARSFRNKDVVLQINTNKATGGSVLNIGKFPYYYESDVRPITTTKSKQPNKPASTTVPVKKYTTPIEPSVFEDVMASICDNSVHLKIKGHIQPLDNVLYETSFPKNGYKRNLPVYYKQTHKLRFSTIIGLSDDENDLSKVAEDVNSLLAKTNACKQAYRTFNLKLDASTGKYADVSAWDDGGMFMYVEKEEGRVQLRVYKINYSEEEKAKKNKPGPVINNNPCDEMEIILKECILGFKNVKGSFVKKETPATYYTTTLPSLGFKNTNVVESVNIEFENGNMIRDKIIYYSADQDFTNGNDALPYYETLKNQLKNCYSGTVNFSDEKNQKIYELFTEYKGYKIRIALIYLNFFGSSVSITFRLQK